MQSNIEVNPGEILVNLKKEHQSNLSFSSLGLDEEQVEIEGGHLRIVINLNGIGNNDYFRTPTIEIGYAENTAETHWQCEFNGTTILDRTDHHGQSTVLLLNRSQLEELEHHHVNQLVIHGEFPETVHLITSKSFVHLLK
ncbi:MAG: hypothetical protein H6585_07835 [Flavobacteriales bacterium]|nr:hypothetical protein [Flavobacteriales bacterium]MCB9448237.1 hypothetical protein [Flavobacteriales bacterium]